jgi:hypothetical protein
MDSTYVRHLSSGRSGELKGTWLIVLVGNICHVMSYAGGKTKKRREVFKLRAPGSKEDYFYRMRYET